MGLNLDRVLSEYEESTGNTDGDTGQYVLAVVQDTLASSAGDGQYTSFKTNLKGELYTIDTDGNALLTTIDADTSTIAGDTTSISTDLGNLTHVEDTLHSTGDSGMMPLAVRNDAGTALAGDGDYIPLTTDSSGNLRVAGSLTIGPPDSTIDSQAVTVGTTEVAIPTTAEPGRDTAIIQNLGSSSIFVGPTGVTTSSGLEISKRSSLELKLGPSVTVFGISAAAGQDVRVFETA